MPRQSTVIRIGLISPGDVAVERDVVAAVIERSRHRFEKHSLSLKLARWENVEPTYNPKGAQEVVFQELDLENCDLVIAIFWKRWGTVDEGLGSRTEQEVRRVIAARQGKNGSPDLAVYFCGREYTPTEEDLKESQQVLQFKNEIVRDNLLIYREYKTIEDFGHLVTNRLADYLDSWLLQNRLAPTIVCWPDKEPAFIREEGLAEPIGDIRLHVSGHSLADSKTVLAIEIEASTNITSGLSGDGNCQVWLARNSTPDTPLAYGAFVVSFPGNTNFVRFKTISIDATEGIARETLVVRGLRVNPPPVSAPAILGNTSVQCQITVREGGHAGALVFQGTMTVATVVRGIRFGAKPLPSRPTQAGQLRFYASVSFSCPTGAQPDTLLVACLRDHSEEYDVYFTGHDLSFGKELPRGGLGEGNASAVPTDVRGHRLEGTLGPAVDSWEGRIPMYKLAGDYLAWQPKKSVDHYEFGLVLIPRKTSYSMIPQVSGGFGPYILGIDSANVWGQAQHVSAVTSQRDKRAYLPIPRFRPLSRFIDLLVG